METTYLIGAGASAEAVPIVEDTSREFSIFLGYLNSVVSDRRDRLDGSQLINLQSLIMDYEMSIEAANRHLSYDTYAKKLWLKKEFVMLKRLKELISLFYFYINYELWKRSNGASEKEDENILFDNIFINTINGDFKLNKDKRYDAFIAGLCNEVQDGIITIPKNVSIISWNYDLQIELALEEYNLNRRDLSYHYNPYFSGDDGRQNYFSNQIVKLNGCSGFEVLGNINSKSGEKLNVNRWISDWDNPNESLFETLLKYVENKNNVEYNPLINFAWENNIISETIIEQAEKIMHQTKSIVIIGYSFPVFNRKIDEILFKNLRLAENSFIYVQTKNKETFEQTKSRILGLINTKFASKIKFIPDVKQFYVPFELNVYGEPPRSIHRIN